MQKLFFLSLTFLLILNIFAQPSNAINPDNVTIVRDSFGVPHIFGKTDADCGYGLAWVNAEDAFFETQNLMYVAKGFMGRKDGIDGVKADFFVHAIGARRIVEERYAKELTPEYIRYLNGYVQGLNAYAAAHPEQVKNKKAFPVTDKDVLTAVCSYHRVFYRIPRIKWAMQWEGSLLKSPSIFIISTHQLVLMPMLQAVKLQTRKKRFSASTPIYK